MKQIEEEIKECDDQCEKFPAPKITISAAIPEVSCEPYIRAKRKILSDNLNSRKLFIHEYASQKYYELKFSSVTNDAFSRIQERVNSQIDLLVPNAVQRFAVIYDYLKSDKPEQWSDAVHDCRRILKDLADALFPPRPQPRPKIIQGKKIEIKLCDEDYINRLICFIEDNSQSESFEEIVGSHLDFIGNRLDSIYHAASKGSHADITSREEADRYVVYTYMIVGDILSLRS